MTLKLPTDTQRLVIVGKTGSGKTQAAVWHLSQRSITTRPWIVFDFKGDDLIGSIEHVNEIDIKSKPPKRSGLYVVRPLPNQQEDVERFLWGVWNNEGTGVYIDEGYMFDKSAAFNALLTQGRSKRIPLITLSQRPVWLSRFVFSEADYYQIFWLNDKRDRQTVNSFTPFTLEKRLPDYHSFWYNVGKDATNILAPVPEAPVLLEIFHERLKPRKRAI